MTKLRILFAVFAIAITATSLYFSFRILNPTPPRVVTFATGPAGGSYANLGEVYKEILAESGIEVRLQRSDGALENLELLATGQADIGFITMGTADEESADRLRSLGAMFMEPLWVFTRDLCQHDLCIKGPHQLGAWAGPGCKTPVSGDGPGSKPGLTLAGDCPLLEYRVNFH